VGADARARAGGCPEPQERQAAQIDWLHKLRLTI
jgi:hypothetical protein